jgi:gamma-glutamylcyclotransferase (GGCT)/AIG2-like uncharacterized protein YtfP
MRFFFYGTLMAGSGNRVADAVHTRLRELGPATARGRLFAIPTIQGWYPAFVAKPDGDAVHGMAYEALPGFTAEDLALLDDYEACYPEQPERSDYLREEIEVLCNKRRICAEVYVWCTGLPGDARPVGHGDFRAFLKETGSRPFCISAGESSGKPVRLRRG